MRVQLQLFLLDLGKHVVLNISLGLTRLAFLLIVGSASMCLPVSAQNVCDGFESYPIGVFPSAGGWQLVWNGGGNGYQVVGHAPQRSGQALQLVGSSCWDAAAFYRLSFPNRFTLEADLLVLGNLSGGCNVYDVQFGLYNPSLGQWGTAYGIVTFQSDGNIHLDYGTGTSSILMPYTENTCTTLRRLRPGGQDDGSSINGSTTLAQNRSLQAALQPEFG